MARVSPTLSFASAGGKPSLTISITDWQRIEAAYGQSLSETVRSEICAETREYLDWATFEQTVRTISEAATRVRSIKKAVRELRDVVMQCPPKIGRDADLIARRLIANHSGLSFEKGRDGLQNLVLKAAKCVLEGCNLAHAELKRGAESGFRRGDTWNLWVRNLTATLKAHQLPTEVRKDTDKNKTGKPSPFVRFIRELQACFPKEYRRSQANNSDFEPNIALSEAIVRARGSHRVTKRPSRLPK
jgi:hypothetical protein